VIKENFFTERLSKVDINSIIGRAVESNSDYISDQLTKHYDKGEDGKGASLGKYKDFNYKNRFEPIDLKLTGAYRKSIAPKNYGEYFEMNATDSKTEKLVTQFGENILSLSKEDVKNIGEFIKPDIIKDFRNEL